MAFIVRALDSNGDWTFGQGLNDYKSNINAVAQDIQTNLKMFLGDCFFATTTGIDWWNLLGGKNLPAIVLSINNTLLGVTGVTGILQTSINLDPTNRVLTVTYQVQTIYSVLQGTYVFDTGTL